jgi:hypothetical protein
VFAVENIDDRLRFLRRAGPSLEARDDFALLGEQVSSLRTPLAGCRNFAGLRPDGDHLASRWMEVVLEFRI